MQCGRLLNNLGAHTLIALSPCIGLRERPWLIRNTLLVKDLKDAE